MLLVLNKRPRESARLIPDKIKFKQLLELGQLICSTDISSVFKPVKQGKEIQSWIKRHPYWVSLYFENLYCWVKHCIKISNETNDKFAKILFDLRKSVNYKSNVLLPNTAIFRYSSRYKGTQYHNNSELPVEEVIKEYKKYIEWKGKTWH